MLVNEEEPAVVDHYVKKRVLGTGGFGIVSLWENYETKDQFAIKKCKWGLEQGLTPKHKERWSKEVHMMENVIKNDNIVQTRKIPPQLLEALMKHNPAKLPILCMEFCQKGDLRQVISRSDYCSGLPESEVRYILQDVSNAVAYLHSLKITHRDLKPDNIVLQLLPDKKNPSTEDLIYQNDFSRRNNNIVYKLIDLGYAKELDEKSLCASFVGTLQYLAPELFFGKNYSNSVDYWSLGLVAFEIICGTRPFLTNMSPAQWMLHIKAKSHAVICVYEDIEGAIIHSDKMYNENRISKCFQIQLEKWLTLALEYNAKKRGYGPPALNRNKVEKQDGEKKTVTFSNNIGNDDKGQELELQIFSELIKILNKKIINVFCAYTCESNSYEIDEFTMMRTFLGWIARDIRVSVDDLVAILPNGQKIDFNGHATQCWHDDYDLPMLYIYVKGCTLADEITLNLPISIERLIGNPRMKLSANQIKIFATNCMHFVLSEINMYKTLLNSWIFNLKNLLNQLNVVQKLNNNMKIQLDMLQGNHIFAKKSLEFDCCKLNEFNIDTKEHKISKWTSEFDAFSSKFNVVDEAVNHIIIRYESVNRRTLNLNSDNVFLKEKENSDLETLKKTLFNIYDIIRQNIRDKKTDMVKYPDICISMIKYICSFIKTRDKYLKNLELRRGMQQVVDIVKEINKISSTMKSAIDNLSKTSLDLLKLQQNRQQEIWDILNATTNAENNINLQPVNGFLNETVCPAYSQVYSSCTEIETGKPKFVLGNSTTSFVPGMNQNGDLNLENLTISGSLDCSSMISDNLSLRYATQDLLNECFQMHKNIMSEELDFEFLNDK